MSSEIEKYLQNKESREDVRRLLDSVSGAYNELVTTSGLCLATEDDGAWYRVDIIGEQASIYSAYYRPDGADRFLVSDLGEGVRAYRLRTGDSAPTFYHVRGNLGPGIGFAEGGTLSHVLAPTAEELPDAICRTLLASYRVANLSAERSGDGE